MLSNPKFKKHVVQPKKVMTPYFLFMNQNYPEMKKNFPDLKMMEITKKSSEIWNNFNEKQKKVYEDF